MARKKLTRAPSKTILIALSNEANALYFSQMRKDCRYANLNVATIDGAKDLHDFISRAAKLRTHGGFTVVWAVFDFADFGVGVEEVKEAIPFAEQKKIKLGWNNPSQSLWYLLHFQTPAGLVENKEAFDGALAQYVPGYRPGTDYLLTDGLAFHLSLFPSLAKAANGAIRYNAVAEQKTGLAATTMVRVINDITTICGKADITHNQRRLGRKA